MLTIKDRFACKWDLVSLGEVMLRFDPGDERIHSARNFRVWEGGGEYNVARNLSKCFRLRTAIVTALADNQIGRLVEDLAMQGGVDTSEVLWRETDAISGSTRNGIYFMERGFGVRPPTGCSDRGNTAVSQLTPGELDWKAIFQTNGAQWFHTGGIFAGLSGTTADVALEAMQAARESGAIVSYDLNYRESLWASRGGLKAANEMNRRLLDHADVVFGAEDFQAALQNFSENDFIAAARKMISRHPGLKVVATTLRDVRSASMHSLSGVCFGDENVHKGLELVDVPVLDRVGSGDAFAAGLIYGLLDDQDLRSSLDLAVASAALSLSAPGDGSSATLGEIQKLTLKADHTAIR